LSTLWKIYRLLAKLGTVGDVSSQSNKRGAQAKSHGVVSLCHVISR
jgi:hypothetical protein